MTADCLVKCGELDPSPTLRKRVEGGGCNLRGKGSFYCSRQ